MNSYQFKFKPDKIKYLTNISTLDSSHSKISEDMIKKRENLPKKEIKLEKFKKKLDEINKNIENENFTNNKSLLLTEIDNLETEINEIKNYDKELDYYSRTYEILFNYYDIIDGNSVISKEELETENIKKTENINQINNQLDNYENNNNEDENIDNSFFQDITDNDIFKKEKVDKLEMLNYLSKLKRKEKKITRKRIKNIESLVKENNNIFDYLDSTKDKSDINNQTTINKNSNIITEKKEENYIINNQTIINNNSNIITEKKEENYIINNVKNNNIENNNIENNNIENNNIENNNIENNNIEIENNNFNKKPKLDRASLYEDYKTLLEGYFTQKKNNKVCINCNIDKILIYSEGIYACIKCGDVERCIIENETTNYKDPMIEKPTFPYKRKNHFCEWIFFIFLTARKSINSYIW